jgi:LppP/LprE lipoprotein
MRGLGANVLAARSTPAGCAPGDASQPGRPPAVMRALARLARLLPVLLGVAAAVGAEAAWLDESPPPQWNHAGGTVPRAPALNGNDDPRCRRSERPAETPEDHAVVQAGWRLFRDYQAGWRMKLVWGLVSYDGMCRPIGYQVFVFIDRRFAGTIAPAPMSSRTDGSATSVMLVGSPDDANLDALSVTFARYTDNDPLCCPSRNTLVRYRLARQGNERVLVPALADTTGR